MKVLKERKGPPFALDAETMRMEFNAVSLDVRALYIGRVTLQAAALTFFLTALAAYGWLLGAGAQYRDKFTLQELTLLKVLAFVLPLFAVAVHLTFLLIQRGMHYLVATNEVHILLLRFKLYGGEELKPDDSPPAMKKRIWFQSLIPNEMIATGLHWGAINLWMYLASKTLS